mmetsp:Transcript_20171/g.27794  ORF Transcript_20171/g.27794 Transcript_20171/m.27794 type:complete len:114 (+) Transcript_20171:50-391(+)
MDEIRKTTLLLNCVCANRKQLLEKEIHILPSSLKITINRQSEDKFKNTEQLLNSILNNSTLASSNGISNASVNNSNLDILYDQTVSYNSFEKSAAALRKFSINFVNYTDGNME